MFIVGRESTSVGEIRRLEEAAMSASPHRENLFPNTQKNNDNAIRQIIKKDRAARGQCNGLRT